MKKRTSYHDGRDETRRLVAWNIEKAKRFWKRGYRRLPHELEETLFEQGVNIKALKSRYQN